MSILVVGSVALDTVKTPCGRRRDVLGGSATYFSLSACFFHAVNLVAVVGRDFPPRYISLFKKRKIDINGLEVKEGKTFRWEGEYGDDYANPRTLSTCLNVFSGFNPCIPQRYENSRCLFLANIDPSVQLNVLNQMRKPSLIVSDTMNYWIENKRKELMKVLKKTDLFFLNDLEAKMLTAENSLPKIAGKLLNLGPKIVVIKRGEYGAALFMRKFSFTLPALLLNSISDPTGAGDTFAGGFLGYLSNCPKINHNRLKRALAYGCVMAAFAVEDFSIKRLCSINRRDIEKRFSDFKKQICF